MGTITETQCINRHHQAIVIEALNQATDHLPTPIDHRLTSIDHLTTFIALITSITMTKCINRHRQAIVIEALNKVTDNQVIVIEALAEATDDRLTDIDHRLTDIDHRLKVIDHQTIAIEAPTMVEATDHRLTLIEAVIIDTMHDQTTTQVAIEEIVTVQVIETVMLHHTVDRALIQVRYLINKIRRFQKLKLSKNKDIQVEEHTEVMKLLQALNKEVLKLVKVS